ncbi:hypothetical protein MIT9_P0196 [Methylomarinovum caldicuralii]|uniref:Calcineurin-like phosphoesterase domain-containing protein n=1 Tax=Methylomarinovum caldicuralii TaxID=438856 RepID=A0AAU9CMD8_9GAMM|nr:UDP-2,3-diacylglucosamine diphosphatase [Methylomarinovum caldicuralii]BCX80622.1 hypothetical protein MIT9_P0196 [Methylomarinovum caldicuralii]
MLEFRTVCISDVHLGTRSCKAEYLLDFLRHVQCERLYLVGDILDLWRLRKGGWYWSDLHQAVAQRFFNMARSGTEVIYIPGNHDELLRGYLGTEFNGIQLRERCVHEAVNGRRLLVLHGDEYDTVITAGGLLSVLGCFTYDTLVEINRWVNLYRARRGLPYWSLAGFLKSRVKNAQRYIADYEEALLHNVSRRGYDGVICGHIHHPALREDRAGFYGNCGDWVENCTALVEDVQGRWRLIHWVTESARLLEVKEKADLALAG